MTKLSIIIVNWNTATLLKQCLESLDRGGGAVEGYEVIIVDNGSTDGSVDYVESITSTTSIKGITSIKLIENKENLGFAKGNNIGLKEAKGEYVFFLNTDTVVQDRAITILVETLEERKEVGAVSPLILNSNGTVQKDPCYLKLPSVPLVFFYYNKYLKILADKFFPWLLYSKTNFAKASFVDQLPGAALMVRKAILDKIGGFDERYKLYFEDTDLSVRIKREGYRLLVQPKSTVIHLGRQSIRPLINKEGIEKFYLLNFRSLFKYCKEYLPQFDFWLIKHILFMQFLLTGKSTLIENLSKDK